MYEADKKAHFAAHPEKKPKEQRISDWKAKGGDGGKRQGKGQGKGGGRGYGGGPDAFPWGAGHGTLRVTRTGEQAGKALRSQGHHYARVM